MNGRGGDGWLAEPGAGSGLGQREIANCGPVRDGRHWNP
jgi:hypothetical protein